MSNIYVVNYINENKQYITQNKEEILKIIKKEIIEYKKFNSLQKANKWINKKIKKINEEKLELYYSYKELEKDKKEIKIINQFGDNMMKNHEFNNLKITNKNTFITEENTSDQRAELIALFLSLKIANNSKNINKIFIESELIFKYWLRKIHNELDEKTKKILYDCIELYNTFKENGGILILKK